jgi:hypothetical protein
MAGKLSMGELADAWDRPAKNDQSEYGGQERVGTQEHRRALLVLTPPLRREQGEILAKSSERYGAASGRKNNNTN